MNDLTAMVPVPRLDVRVRNLKTMLVVSWAEQVFQLEDVAMEAWRLIDGHRSIADIARILGDQYDVPAEEVTHDVLEMFSGLEVGRILELVNRS